MASIPARYRFDIPVQYIRDFDRQTRRRLGPAATFIGERIVENAIAIARKELVNNRPDGRRNRATTRGRPHYVDSFTVGAPDVSGGRVRVLVRNSSPVSNLIELGSGPHTIPGPGKFPIGTSSWGGRNYASEAGPWRRYGVGLGGGSHKTVSHPGHPGGYRIVERAIKEEEHKPRRIKLAINASLKQ